MTRKKGSIGKSNRRESDGRGGGGSGSGAAAGTRKHRSTVKPVKAGQITTSGSRTDEYGWLAMKWAIFPFVLMFGVLIRLMPEAAMAVFGGAGKNYCVWVDEVWTLMLDRLPFKDALYLIHHFDAVPPLSYLFLRMTPQMDDGTILRIVPGVFSAMALAVFLWFGARHLKRDEVWLVGVLLALSPIHFWYSLNLRYYGLMELVAALFIVITARLVASGRGIRVQNRTHAARYAVVPLGVSTTVHLWLLLGVAGLLTHNLFALAILAAIFAIAAALGRRALALFKNPVQYAWVTIPAAYWLQVFLWQREFVGGYKLTMKIPGIGELFATYRDFLLLYFQPPSITADIIASIVIIVPVGVFVYDMWVRARKGEIMPVIAVICAWIAFFPPLIAVLLMYIARNPQLLSRRYLIPSGIAFLVVWALGCLKIRIKSIRLALILAVAMFNLLGLDAVLMIQAPPDWKSVAETIQSQTGTESIWVISRESTDNLVVTEAICLSTYLPEIPAKNFHHYTVSLEGPSPQVFALSRTISRMSERTVAGYSRYYPPHISMLEFQSMIERTGAGSTSSIPGAPDSLPDKLYVAYPVSEYRIPSAEADMGDTLSHYFDYSERTKLGGITIDLWTRK